MSYDFGDCLSSDGAHDLVKDQADHAFQSPASLSGKRFGTNRKYPKNLLASDRSVNSTLSRRTPSLIHSSHDAKVFGDMNRANEVVQKRKSNKKKSSNSQKSSSQQQAPVFIPESKQVCSSCVVEPQYFCNFSATTNAQQEEPNINDLIHQRDEEPTDISLESLRLENDAYLIPTATREEDVDDDENEDSDIEHDSLPENVSLFQELPPPFKNNGRALIENRNLLIAIPKGGKGGPFQRKKKSTILPKRKPQQKPQQKPIVIDDDDDSDDNDQHAKSKANPRTSQKGAHKSMVPSTFRGGAASLLPEEEELIRNSSLLDLDEGVDDENDSDGVVASPEDPYYEDEAYRLEHADSYSQITMDELTLTTTNSLLSQLKKYPAADRTKSMAPTDIEFDQVAFQAASEKGELPQFRSFAPTPITPDRGGEEKKEVDDLINGSPPTSSSHKKKKKMSVKGLRRALSITARKH